MNQILPAYCELLKARYPSAAQLEGLSDRLQTVVTDRILRIPKVVLQNAAKAVSDIYQYSHSPKFVEMIAARGNANERDLITSANTHSSVLMAYDFHWDPPTGNLSLIEVNTNASAFLLTDLLYQLPGSPNVGPALTALRGAFANEKMLFDGSTIKRIAIVDEEIESQKMYPEFLMFKDLFRSWDLQAEIVDYQNLKAGEFDFVYNRYCDFLFDQPRSAHLRKMYLEKSACFSPHPREYMLLADKGRLLDFAADKVSPTIIPTFPVWESTPDDLWAKRKRLIFKPLRSFGGKGVYRGGSISRKVFDALATDDSYLAQEFRPPPEQDGFKYDLRFYAYRDQIQLPVARFYQGQVTNFSQPGGGLARIEFT